MVGVTKFMAVAIRVVQMNVMTADNYNVKNISGYLIKWKSESFMYSQCNGTKCPNLNSLSHQVHVVDQ